jgi:hypothetical protein
LPTSKAAIHSSSFYAAAWWKAEQLLRGAISVSSLFVHVARRDLPPLIQLDQKLAGVVAHH